MTEPSHPKEFSEHESPPQIRNLRMERCPKCSYTRQPADNAYTSLYECPKCGVVYAMAMEEIRKRNKGIALQDEAEVHEQRTSSESYDGSIHNQQVSAAMFIGREKSHAWVVVVLGLVLLAVGLFFLL